VKGEPFVDIPLKDLLRLRIGYLGGLIIQSRLGETLLVHSALEKQFVGNDGVVHAHAPLVEHPQNGFFATEAVRDVRSNPLGLLRNRCRVKRLYVIDGMFHFSMVEPGFKTGNEPFFAEILAPQGAVDDSGFGHGAIKIQHSHQTRPGSGPVGHGEDGGAVRNQPVQNVMGILPNRLRHDQGTVGIHLREHRHAFFLGANKSVFLILFVGMNPFQIVPQRLHSVRQLLFHAGLCGPAGLIGA
jgi:hypothetical protein